MALDRRTLGAAVTLALVGLALPGCGDSEERAAPAGGIGEARLATNGDPSDLMTGSSSPREGVAQGEPPTPSKGAPVGVGAPQRACNGGALQPTRDNLKQVSRATLCLLNVERRTRGLRPLRSSSRLARAALGHSRDMVRRSYFAHDSRSGATFMDRIRRMGYLRDRRTWVLGENIAWGGGSRSTPRAVVGSWMRSPPHRANILQRRFREIGIGSALGSPVGTEAPAATYTTDFGA